MSGIIELPRRKVAYQSQPQIQDIIFDLVTIAKRNNFDIDPSLFVIDEDSYITEKLEDPLEDSELCQRYKY